jgi:hypothetical protein
MSPLALRHPGENREIPSGPSRLAFTNLALSVAVHFARAGVWTRPAPDTGVGGASNEGSMIVLSSSTLSKQLDNDKRICFLRVLVLHV